MFNSVFKKSALVPVFLFGLLFLAAGTETLLPGQEPGGESGASEGSYSFVILPDTQYYYGDQGAGNFSKWLAQMNWIRDHAESDNLKYVLHLGDITDQADHSSTHLTQWRLASSVSDGIMEKVPLALVTGNHDGLENSRTSLFSDPEYFGAGSVYANQPTLIETMESDRWENSVHRIEIQGRSWLIICLEWGPRDEVITWADDVLSRFPDDYAIVTTHAYLFRDSSRFDWGLLGAQNKDDRQSGNPIGYDALNGDPEGANDGQLMWNKLIRRHSNIKLVLNGHVSRSGHGRRVSINDDRHYVQEHLVNFDGERLTIEIEPVNGETYTTRFVGSRRGVQVEGVARKDADGNIIRTTLDYTSAEGPQIGEIFSEVTGNLATYQLEGDEIYVRAIITSDAEPDVPSKEFPYKRAWTQPVGWTQWIDEGGIQ